ncbi:MAG: hypothetical protein J5966_04900, partial [Lachnospiraceae bacterium]|nr:hypothetical protein [Lachnospiraceae bacterium]
TLAYNIARYMLSQNENIDRASIGTLWKNGEVDFVKNAIRVSYKEIGSDETKYAYFDYFAYYRDGDAIGTKGHSGMRDYDHIVVLEKQAATYNEDGTAATFVNKGDVMVSELAINNMKDPYQNTFASANAALAELTAAESEMQEIEDTINGYSDAESIADKLDRKKEELKAAQEAFKKDERVEELTLIIKQQQEKLKTLTNTDQFWRERRRLTEYFVEYALRGQGEVTSFEILPVVGKNEAWNRDNGTMNHYVAIKYRMDGEEHLSYFDYIAYYDDGETVSSNNSNTSNFIGKSSMYVKDSSFTPDHIVVVQKNQIEKYNGDIPVLFSDKGTPLISEADFNAGRDHYQSSKSRISSLENDVERLQSALTIADNIKALKDEAEAADTLKGKVSEAKDKVDKAAEALKNARITRAMNSDKLKELTGKLEEARREYESLLEELKIANGRVESIKNIISGIISQTETGYTVSHPEETTHADETSSPKAAEDSKEVIQDQNTADNDKPETPIESVETVEENTADISGEESPAEADAGIIGEEASTEIVGDEAVVDDGDRDEDVDDAYGVSEDSTDADSSVDAPETYETPDITSFDVLGEMRTMEIPGLEPIRAETSSSVFENISSGSQASSAGLASGDLEELDMGVAGERKAPRMAPTQDAQNVRSAVRKKSIVETGLTYSYWLAVLILCLGAAQKIVKKLLTEKPD